VSDTRTAIVRELTAIQTSNDENPRNCTTDL